MPRSGGNRRKLAETHFGAPIVVRKYSQVLGWGACAELSAIGVSLAETAETALPAHSGFAMRYPPSGRSVHAVAASLDRCRGLTPTRRLHRHSGVMSLGTSARNT